MVTSKIKLLLMRNIMSFNNVPVRHTDSEVNK